MKRIDHDAPQNSYTGGLTIRAHLPAGGEAVDAAAVMNLVWEYGDAMYEHGRSRQDDDECPEYSRATDALAKLRPLLTKPAPVSAGEAVDEIMELVDQYGRLMDQVGRSRDATRYARNKTAVANAVGVLDQIRQRLAHPAPSVSAWVPVSERLPAVNEMVLVWCAGSGCAGLAWRSRFGGIDWIIPEPQPIGYESITHWQALPPAPTASGEGEEA